MEIFSFSKPNTKRPKRGIFNMPQALHNEEVSLNQEVVWEFLKDYNNWAPLVPGYIGHDVQSDSEFTWIFLADLGFTKKIKRIFHL